MNRINNRRKYVFGILIFVCCFSACDRNKKKSEGFGDALVLVDTNKKYPKKTIHWAEFADSIEYIPLETTSEFLCGGDAKVIGFTDKYIILSNNSAGNILIFNRQGKGIGKISKKGQGPGEYSNIFKCCYDSNTGEIFVYDIFQGKVFVYDLHGIFLRSFPAIGQELKYNGLTYHEMMIYNHEYLICYTANKEVENPYFLISRQTGEKISDIIIPIKKKLAATQSEGGVTIALGGWSPMIKSKGQFFIKEPSSDTIYCVSPSDNILRPLMVQTPSSQVEAPKLLLLNYQTGPFLFMTHVNKDFSNEPTSLIYDYRDHAIYENDSWHAYTVLGLNMNGQMLPHATRDNVFMNGLIASRAKQLENEDGIDSKLKDLVSKMSDDDNPLLTIITLKKKK